jgi:hypothetical protein
MNEYLLFSQKKEVDIDVVLEKKMETRQARIINYLV